MTQDLIRVPVLTKSGDIEYVSVSPDVVAAARQLAYAPDRYFDTSQSRLLKLDTLVQSRAREKGIANAVALMAAAYRGETSRRGPIHVRLLDSQRYLVVDGNSTVTIAAAANWPDVPCLVLD